MLRICRSQMLDMGLKRVMWVPRYQGQCRALQPLGHQGYRLRSYNKDQPLCSGYTEGEPAAFAGSQPAAANSSADPRGRGPSRQPPSGCWWSPSVQ